MSLTAKLSLLVQSAVINNFSPQLICQRLISTAGVDLAARKGTREKASKKKQKVEVKKVGFIPHNQRDKYLVKKSATIKNLEHLKKPCADDVWPMRFYSWKVYTIAEAIELKKEVNSPTMFNLPNEFVDINIELNMRGEKVTKSMEGFSRLAMVAHGFEKDVSRSILVFCKGNELQEQAMKAGATIAGGVDLIKDIQKGEIALKDYDTVVAHSNILTDLVPLRGLMKRKFPNPRAGTLDNDVVGMIKKFLNGIEYTAVKDSTLEDYGTIKASFGRLNMDTKHLEENLIALLNDINNNRPKREGTFVTKCYITSKPCSERLKIDPFSHIEFGVKSTGATDETTKEEVNDEDDVNEEKSKAAATA